MLSKLPAVAFGTAIAFCAFAAPGARAGAAPASTCTAQSGVTVIVDFAFFGGAIERGCDAGQPASALDAIQAGGFSTAGTARYGDAFVCRIDGRPSSQNEACTDTPPADSSWAFYYARPNDRSWTYSAAGVLSYQPPPGSLIAFAFGDHTKPRVLPSGAVVTSTTTTIAPRRATPPSTTTPVTALANPPGTAPPAVTVAPATAVPTATSTTATTVARATHATTPAAAPSTTGPQIVDKTASARVPNDGGSGSPLPAVVTVALVAALGGGAFALIRSRRRRAA